MEDTNVWVYTAEFAERFSMPEAWIDKGLTGAHAAAFRVETFDARLMLPHKGPDVGLNNRFCILDLYLPANAELPWNTDELHGGTHITPISRAYLSPRREEDQKRNLSEVGIPITGKGARRPLIYFGRGVNGGSSLSLINFERDIYPGLD
ncbi:MAG: hypothetical protein RQ736_09975, partial [Thiogranum sp.]|nr:hypothetical protein [Thiogranum sp.]